MFSTDELVTKSRRQRDISRHGEEMLGHPDPAYGPRELRDVGMRVRTHGSVFEQSRWF